jgi:ribose 1,5-bisphosphokinase PhnN
MLKPHNRPITDVTAMLVVLITALPILLAQRLITRTTDTDSEKS